MVARVGLLAVAVAGVVVAWRLARAPVHVARARGERWVCAMHPDVMSPEPGRCPICGMALEPLAATPASDVATARYLDYVRQRSFAQDVIAAGWLDDTGTLTAIVYKDEAAGLASDLDGVFNPSNAPGAPVPIHWIEDAATPWDRSTMVVRFQISAKHVALARGAVGWIKVATRSRSQLVIPASALLEGEDGPFVLVAGADGRTLTRRAVEVGRVVGGMAFVVGGLRQRERVIVRDAFFFDAERRLHGAASQP